MKHKHFGVPACVVSAVLICVPSLAMAATAPNLGSTSTYGIASSTYTNTVVGTTINGDVCYTTAPVVAPIITGATVNPTPAGVITDQGAALAQLNSQPCVSLGGGAVSLNAVIIGANPPGTIPPGCYSSGGAMNIVATTTVTLSGDGVYIFRPNGAITTGANSSVVLAGACADNVFWAPIAATTLGASSTFVGTIIDAAGITIGQFADLTGRALAAGGTVLTDTNTITVPAVCPAPPPVLLPTLSKSFGPASIDVNGVSTLTITLSNPNAIAAGLTSALVDTLPNGLVVAATPNASTTCLGTGAVIAAAGGTTVTLPSTRSIPGGAPGTCTVTVDVTSAVAGSYVNTLAAGALQTNNGNNALPASATLPVGGVPALPWWAIITLMALLATTGYIMMRRRAV